MYARRRHVYFAMMGLCLSLFVVACAVVRLWSVPAAVAMCVVAMVIPPFAAIVANRKGPEDRWYDDPDPGAGSGRGDESPTPPTHVRKKDPRDGPGTPPVKPPSEPGHPAGPPTPSGSTGISGGHGPGRGHGGHAGRRGPLSDQDRVKGSDPESEAWWRELDRRGSGGDGPPGPPGHGSDPRRPGPWPEE